MTHWAGAERTLRLQLRRARREVGVYDRPPRAPDDRVIDARMWARVVFVGRIMAAATLLTIDLYLPGGLFEGTRELDDARTAIASSVLWASELRKLVVRRARRVPFG